jgi:dipeptidyl aminopeptidase/acylaminoacyl peptidase
LLRRSSAGGGPPPAEWLAKPAWSPDGRLAYVTGPRTSFGTADYQRAEIWISNADGSERRRLVSASPDQRNISNLEWSADGSRLAYVVELGNGWSPGWVSSDGARSAGLNTIERPRHFWTSCCTFSPDAARAVFTTPGTDGAMEVRVTSELEAHRRIADG